MQLSVVTVGTSAYSDLYYAQSSFVTYFRPLKAHLTCTTHALQCLTVGCLTIALLLHVQLSNLLLGRLALPAC